MNKTIYKIDKEFTFSYIHNTFTKTLHFLLKLNLISQLYFIIFKLKMNKIFTSIGDIKYLFDKYLDDENILDSKKG